MFDANLLINETGEYDFRYMRINAMYRATKDFGPNPPPSLIRSHFLNLKTQAYFVRYWWRRDRGLPDDTVYCDSFPIVEPERRWA